MQPAAIIIASMTPAAICVLALSTCSKQSMPIAAKQVPVHHKKAEAHGFGLFVVGYRRRDSA